MLPPLCAELRNEVMLPMVLPMVLTIAESQVCAYLRRPCDRVSILDVLISESDFLVLNGI